MKRSKSPYRNSVTPKVSVIIPVMNEKRMLSRVIREAYRVHPQTEVIVVDNGSTDGSRGIAVSSGAKVIHFDDPLGHDVGRSIGAMQAKGDILLFMDGDFVVRASNLKTLVHAVLGGVDVALNSYLGFVHKSNVHSVVLAKHTLNTILSHQELRGASMTTIPHAISRRALELIGHEALAVPPLAQAIAIHRGLNVKAVHYINVRANPIKRKRKGRNDPLMDLITGDHLEAIGWLLEQTNERGNQTDFMRRREIVR
jgi:glycosyltransferase involved in cell wall biosynthesis